VDKGAPQTDADRSTAPSGGTVRIGVISDTHGSLDPTVLEVFAGVVQIMLESVAPVVAVAGNVDPPELTERLPREAAGVVDGISYVVSHKRKRLLKHLAAGDFEGGKAVGEHPDLAVFGHEHSPSVAWVDGTLHLNPGSASAPYEEDDGPTVAIVERGSTGLAVRFVPLTQRDQREMPTP
jgi:putative phosphoesterase